MLLTIISKFYQLYFIYRYEARGSATALEECSLKMAELQKHVDAKSAEKKATESKIEKLRKQLANSKVSGIVM